MLKAENLLFVAIGALIAAHLLRKQYTPHIHTAACPQGYPVPPGECIENANNQIT